MTAVTVLGLGPMGTALTRAFVTAGHRTTAWSRTASTPAPDGATRASTAAEAIAAGELTVVCVRGDAAVAAVLDPIGDLTGRVVINLTSGSPTQARSRAEWAGERGADYLAGAIMTPTPSIGTAAALTLYSGPESIYGRWSETLAALGGTARYLGPDPGRAAAFDVSLLDMFWQSVSGIVHGLALARAEGISGADLAPFGRTMAGLLPDMVAGFAAQLDQGEFPGTRSTIASAEAGLAHITETAEGHGIDASGLRAGLDLIRKAMDAGHATDGLARLADVLYPGESRAQTHRM
ncbi:NAD(P)-dependent oxidoreductase [Kutzneria buriramensis]|uniref:3-hydroxyisobutyrate dehydrogenase-like beta-hydroxyacid dehydrogenase n=1 Tax=Kutzneria buriramensis TaxID=1045776 RepID=A0A3E0H0N5_9PSEU|nr:NAD(P)-binding domain-containing protein [Kutzneria buriramensis]REH36191.1 3-hydroxyisobutyrate dehydrogenase-like beta-hydroxyacid dehydrogenase [Kutzneria buriramensis]